METLRPGRIVPTRHGGKLRMVRILGPVSEAPGSWLVLDVKSGETTVAPASALGSRQAAAEESSGIDSLNGRVKYEG